MICKDWKELGRSLAKPLVFVLFLCNLITPYYDVIDSPLWFPYFAFKKVLLTVWHIGYLILFTYTTRVFYTRGMILPTFFLALFLTLIYSSKAVFVEYPDCCSGIPVGAPRYVHTITLGNFRKDQILFKVYLVHESNVSAWYLNDTYELVNTYYADKDECSNCIDTPIH